MQRQLLLALTLLGSIQSATFAEEVTVKSGDTLSGIASQYNVSVRSIMDRNELFNADALTIGQKLRLPEGSANTTTSQSSYHIVKEGENIGTIASNYDLEKQTLLSLNELDDPNLLYIGQKIVIPHQASSAKAKAIDVSHHTVSEGETLTIISEKYNISIKELTRLNNFDNPNIIQPGTKISLKSISDESNRAYKTSSHSEAIQKTDLTENIPDWRNYGSLKINWTSWKYINGNYVTPALNFEGKPLFLAVNCSTTKMNHTGKDNKWKQWFTPSQDFEFELVDNLCDSESS